VGAFNIESLKTGTNDIRISLTENWANSEKTVKWKRHSWLISKYFDITAKLSSLSEIQENEAGESYWG